MIERQSIVNYFRRLWNSPSFLTTLIEVLLVAGILGFGAMIYFR